ncbi:hypothetical protein BH10PSE9_BH10PSE9_16550 [soil metagenome]
MAGHWGRVFGCAVAALGIAGAGIATAYPTRAVAAAVEPVAVAKEGRGSVYLFLGLANVFSTGLETLSDQLRARGVRNTVLNYGGWPNVADEIVERTKRDPRALPVIIIGHSFGADAVIEISAALATRGIPVALAVTFDATQERPVPANVRHFINYYSAMDGIGKRLEGASGFRGRLENINVDTLDKGIGHFDIEKFEDFHKRVIGEVLGVIRAGGTRSAGAQ